MIADTDSPANPLPLTGVRVLDLGHVFQGPYATFLMAMAGADVIKIEPPHGEMSRRRGRDGDYPFRALNGCKRGIVLNLKTERGRELLIELSRKADVLVENFAPSVMTRLGLGPDVLLKANPRLIYASGSGFGRTGPYADKLALDLTIQAMSGVMSATGEAGGRPLKAGVPVADFMSGAHLYGGIVTALYERERTGRGRVVEVSMLESMFATLLPAAGHTYQSNAAPKRSGNRHVADSYVPFDTFETADGWVAIVCATDEHGANLTEAMDRPDLRADESLHPLHGRIARIDEVTAAVAQWTATRTREKVSALCQKHHVAAAPVRDVLEVLRDPHLHAAIIAKALYPACLNLKKESLRASPYVKAEPNRNSVARNRSSQISKALRSILVLQGLRKDQSSRRNDRSRQGGQRDTRHADCASQWQVHLC
jgi:crotonobetainyl-CoA:carnitine CoA-transferase CaiB-like acyl-CoA transferase